MLAPTTTNSWVKNPGYDSAASSLFARMSSEPSATRKGHINTLISALKTAGIWTKLDVLYILAAHDAQAARLNWKADAYNLTAVNSPTFTTDRGYAGDGSTSYLDTGWDAATNGAQFTQNSATIFGWSRTAGQNNGFWLGTGTALSIALRPRSTADALRYYVNAASLTDVANTDGSGLLAASRSGANATQSYRNGNSIGSAGSVASGALSSVDVNIGRCNSTFNPAQCAAMGLGANLNATEHAALYTALNTYLTAVGAA